MLPVQVLHDLMNSDRATGGHPVLPEGSREAIVKALALAVVDDTAREEYRGALLRRARELGGATPSMLVDVLTDEQADGALASGLGALGDGELARLALCPPEVAGLAHVFLEVLSSPDPEVQARYNGLDAWREALHERLVSRPSGQRAHDTIRVHCAGSDESLPRQGKADLSPVKQAAPESAGGVIPLPVRTPVSRRRQLAYGMAVAVAASLLIGVGVLLGKIIFQGGPRTSEEVLLAAVEPQARLERGETQPLIQNKEGVYGLDTKARFQVTIQSPRRGFATIVLLAEGVTQVRPDAGGEAFAIDAFKSRQYGPITPPPGKFAVLVVVTPTPAMDLIKKALPAAGCSPDSAEEVLKAVQQQLWKDGMSWVAVNRVTVDRVAKE